MHQLLTIQITLIIIGLVGAIDEYLYHHKRLNLILQKECLKENILHILRQFIFSIIFISTACLDTSGTYSVYLMLILFLDILIGFADVIIEPKSRKAHGGLPPGEYFLHMLLSFSLGIFHYNYIARLFESSKLKSTITLSNTSNISLELVLLIMGIFSLLIAINGSYQLFNTKKK